MIFHKPIAEGRISWSSKEEELIKKMVKKKDTLSQIKKFFPKRSVTSIKNKIRRLRFKEDTYGHDHRKEKYNLTNKWVDSIHPRKVFEGFAGEGKSTIIYLNSESVKEIHSCEINHNIFNKLLKNLKNNFLIEFKELDNADLKVFIGKYKDKKIILVNEDSQKWAARLYSRNETFDFLDLDTCGTVLPSLSGYLKLLNRGYFLLTLGEFHSYRFGRKDALIKSNPLIFKEIISNKFINKMSMEDFYDSLIPWISFLGSQTISYNELKEITLEEKKILGQKPQGVCRVLFSVKRADSLANILNKTSEYLEKQY